ncbi:MAG: nucleotidyltransferase domain-containing protein [Caldilinea sp. CFX5]|nr:nucleotidyltransferase domain-containing protein [Caldilinea sp. CFX5]
MDFTTLAKQFDAPTVKAIVLMGSHARGDAGPYSDVDLVRFVAEADADLAGAGSHLLGSLLVVVSNVTPSQVEAWFTEPKAATETVAGLRLARVLVDRNHTFVAIQARAQAFAWDEMLQGKADLWASEQMVGWIEEVHKGLEGLRRRDPGRLLNASFGLSWGLSNVVKVQRGVLVSGDNGFFNEVAAAVGVETAWSQLRAIAFGVADVHGRPPSLRERVVAGLHLYGLTAELLGPAIQPEHAPLIAQTIQLINQEIEKAYHGEQ